MTINRYQELAQQTAIYPEEYGLLYTILGLANEAGEVAGKYKKVFRDNQGELTEEKKQQLIDELSDVCWYLAMVARELDTDLESVFQYNLDKLFDRKERGVLQGSGDKR